MASEYLGVVTLVGQQKIAGSIGGTALNLTTVRVGDGTGAAITPNETMTDLVRRVGGAYAIVSSGRDPVNPQMWRVTAVIGEAEGPFDIREIAVFDNTGAMIAIAKHPFVTKTTVAQGNAVALTTDIVFPVSSTAQVTVTLSADVSVDIAKMLRAPFLVVESASVLAPPANPALGRTHVIPAGGTGAAATAAIAGGAVTGVTITNGGAGYVSPTVTFVGGNGAGATGTVTVVDGIVTGVTITNPGAGYTAAPNVVFTPAAATGAWAGQGGKLAQWNGTVWALADVPEGHVVVALDKAVDAPLRWLRRTATGWISATASETAFGVVALATVVEVQAATRADRAVTPAGLRRATRIKLSGDLTVYVRSDGNDANGGLANTAAGAFATIQGAWDSLKSLYDVAGFAIVIQLGIAGTYIGASFIGASGKVRLQGDPANPDGFIVTKKTGEPHAILAAMEMDVDGIQILLPAGGSYGLSVGARGFVNYKNILFTSQQPSGFPVFVNNGGFAAQTGNLKAQGDAQCLIACFEAGRHEFNTPNTITFFGNPLYSTGFVLAKAGRIYVPSTSTFVGTARGPRFRAEELGSISTGGRGVNYFPGDAAGVVVPATYGLYT